MLKKFLMLLVALFAAAAMAAGAAVDVNKATDAQLDAVKGIGPATSKTILAERKKGGDFKSWDDFISRVKGIGEKKAESLSKEGLTVNGQAYKTAAETKKDAKKEAKATAKEEKKEAKATAKTEKKEAEAKKDAAMAKADAKKDSKDAKADAKKDATDKADAKKDAASAKK
jgi:competence protein ComEA